MTEERYVVVYRDGYVGQPVRRDIAKLIVLYAREYPHAYESLPAYLVRVRLKVCR